VGLVAWSGGETVRTGIWGWVTWVAKTVGGPLFSLFFFYEFLSVFFSTFLPLLFIPCTYSDKHLL
jgi:hypothetical protein